ncbi:MAG: ATP-binding protein [Chloroflexota bacterium]
MATQTQSRLPGFTFPLWYNLQRWLKPRATDRDIAFRERTIRGMVLILFFAAIVLAVVMLAIGAPQRLIQSFLISSLAFVAGIAVHKGRVYLAGWIMVGLVSTVFISGLLQAGYWVPGVYSTSILTLLFAAVLLPLESARKIPFILIVIYVASAFWMQAHGRTSPLDVSTGFNTPLTASIIFAIIIFVAAGIQFYLYGEFTSQRRELKNFIETLEERVERRTHDLEVAAEISKQVATVLDLGALLPNLVERTRSAFDLYHVSIFLLEGENLQYKAGTGEAGQSMKQDGKHFALDAKGLVPQAARTQQPVLVDDVSQETHYFANPYLPATLSEVSLPLIVADNVVGVLDLQSQQKHHFGTDEVKVLTLLAAQLAVAVENARLYAEQVKVAEELRALDDLKSQFLASMSHELRTPLNAILNFSEFVLLEMLGPVNDKQKDALSKSVESGRHLLALINDVLDMSKIEAGMMKLFVEDNINILDELKPVIATAQTLLKEKSVQFIEDIDNNLPTIVGDRRRIRQILLNLISNAAKFTDEGSVTLSVKSRGEEILFAVIDTGPGINLEDQNIIFEPFLQTDHGIKHAGGTGLGLPISRRLAEAHGGNLWVESEDGSGSAFFVTLPIRSTELLQQVS